MTDGYREWAAARSVVLSSSPWNDPNVEYVSSCAMRFTGAYDVPLGVVEQGKDCSYCGTYSIVPKGNCQSCGAPLNRREVKPL